MKKMFTYLVAQNDYYTFYFGNIYIYYTLFQNRMNVSSELLLSFADLENRKTMLVLVMSWLL